MRGDNPDWDLMVVRSVSRIQGAGRNIETNLTADFGAEPCFEFSRRAKTFVFQRAIADDCKRRNQDIPSLRKMLCNYQCASGLWKTSVNTCFMVRVRIYLVIPFFRAVR
jgi:hypothetical protein